MDITVPNNAAFASPIDTAAWRPPSPCRTAPTVAAAYVSGKCANVVRKAPTMFFCVCNGAAQQHVDPHLVSSVTEPLGFGEALPLLP